MSSTAKLKARLVDILPPPIVYRVAPILYRRQEPELGALDNYLPQARTAIDVGGWLGPWTRELSRRCATVHTFEPQPGLAAFLRKVIPDNVTLHEKAVSNVAGSLPLVVPGARHGQNALASLDREVQEGDTVHQVEVVRLDDMGFTEVDFVKIDVEGREREVLEGARELLARERPRLIVEAEQRHLDAPLSAMFDLLADLGYTGWFLHRGTWHPLADFDVQRHQLDHLDALLGPDYINNFLFIPSEDSYSPTA